jgi:hypothetical protein
MIHAYSGEHYTSTEQQENFAIFQQCINFNFLFNKFNNLILTININNIVTIINNVYIEKLFL